MSVEMAILEDNGRVVSNHETILTEDEETGFDLSWNIESVGLEVSNCLVDSIGLEKIKCLSVVGPQSLPVVGESVDDAGIAEVSAPVKDALSQSSNFARGL